MTPPRNYLERLLWKSRKSNELLNRYLGFRDKFDAEIHPYVTANAITADNIFLTDHGPRHIAKVIEKASELASNATNVLNPYETFLLLIAIHLHDVGNAIGRSGHEKNIDSVLDLVYGPLGFDQLDRSFAERIASVHGGAAGGSKDTIRLLEDQVVWKDTPIRPQLVAALLRFADELSDHRDRADAMAIELDRVQRESEIYHVYAYGLHSVQIDARSCAVHMSFAFSKEFFLRRWGKGSSDTLLLDEVFARTMKMLEEAEYCSRYFRGVLRFDRVSVTIEIFDKGLRNRMLRVPYTLEHQGYGLHSQDVYACSPELLNFRESGRLTAATLREYLGEPANG